MRRGKINILFFLTKEGNNGRLGLSSGNDPQLVAHKNLCVRAGTCDHAIVQNARADERPTDEVSDGAHRLTVDAGVGHGDVKENRSVAVGARLLVPMPVFFLEIDAKHLSQDHRRGNDAHHAQRISAGIGNGYVFAFVAQHVERFLCCPEARSVRHGTEMNTEHLR